MFGRAPTPPKTALVPLVERLFTKLELFWKTFGKTASPVELIL
jgi:hypothetical protein